MATGSLKLKLRPLRIAGVVTSTDRQGIREAIRYNSFVWGGASNPILPYYKSFPPTLRAKVGSQTTLAQWFGGCLEAFDPDFVTCWGQARAAELEFGGRKVVQSSILLGRLEQQDYSPTHGIDLFDILNHLERKELRFVSRKPPRFTIPIFATEYNLFLASVFGQVPLVTEELVTARLRQFPEIQWLPCSLDNFTDFLDRDNLFIRKLTSFGYRAIPSSWHHSGPWMFFMDAGNRGDILDYWNLRALVGNILPIPRQTAHTPRLKLFVEQLIEASAVPARNNPEIFRHTTLFKSISCSDDDARAFLSSLKLTPPKHPHDWKVSYQPWFPRIWDQVDRQQDGFERTAVLSVEEQHDVGPSDKTITFKPLFPEFARRYASSEARCANEVEIRLYGNEDLFAEIIPKGGAKLVEAITGWRSFNWRCSETGLVFFATQKGFPHSLELPAADHVFSAVMLENGWTIELSDKGKLAKQMLKRVRGIYGASILANRGCLQLLNKLSRSGPMSARELRTEIRKAFNENDAAAVRSLLKQMVDGHILQLGILLQCPVCTRRSWYKIDDLDYELSCSKCLERFQLPSHDVKSITWSYRTIGPFDVPQMADGAFSTLLTLRLFSFVFDGASTPMLSFIATKGEKKCEVDLGLIFEPSRCGNAAIEMIFAECKTYGRFERRDVRRMRDLGRAFPNSVIVFATLNEGLSDQEKKIIKPLIGGGRSHRSAQRNRILILTATELFSRGRLETTWREKQGVYAQRADRIIGLDRFMSLCAATQDLYL